MYNVSSPVYSGMPKNQTTSDLTSKYVIELYDLYDKLLYKQCQLTSCLKQIEDYIDNLEPRERVIIRSYYIDGMSWEQVASDLKYSVQRIWQIHGSVIKKIRDN